MTHISVCRYLLMYDIFYISRKDGLDQGWNKIKSKYSTAQRLTNIKCFEDIRTLAFTKMFWVIWDDLELNDSFDLLEYKATKWDNNYIHVFKNGDSYDGICLFPKTERVTQREFTHRFFINKKEIDVVASQPKQYQIYNPFTYDEYLNIEDDMFWIVWKNVKVSDVTVFDIYFSHHDFYNRKENHIFKNSCNGKESFINGIFLCSKHKKLSKREFDIKYLIDKKEHDRVVSKSMYPVFEVDTYEDYLRAIDKTTDEMLWIVYPEIEIFNTDVFDLYFDARDGKYDYDRNINHVFQHRFKDNEITYNGLMLMSKNCIVGKREIDFRYLINKKEYNTVVSKHRSYDIIFISYNESNADENFQKLQNRFPRAKRIHGVKGIHQAHIRAAELATTEMLWVVDGDAEILDDFNFDHVVTRYERNVVYVWQSKNPINGLVYGYGGVKLLPRQLTLAMDVNSADMTTSISDQFKSMQKVSNITVFNTDPFNTWKSAFRECVKLSAKLINRQNDDETTERLEIWCTQGRDKLYGEDAIAGAIAGKEFGLAAKGDKTELIKINDFEWLKNKFYGI